MRKLFVLLAVSLAVVVLISLLSYGMDFFYTRFDVPLHVRKELVVLDMHHVIDVPSFGFKLNTTVLCSINCSAPCAVIGWKNWSAVIIRDSALRHVNTTVDSYTRIGLQRDPHRPDDGPMAAVVEFSTTVPRIPWFHLEVLLFGYGVIIIGIVVAGFCVCGILFHNPLTTRRRRRIVWVRCAQCNEIHNCQRPTKTQKLEDLEGRHADLRDDIKRSKHRMKKIREEIDELSGASDGEEASDESTD